MAEKEAVKPGPKRPGSVAARDPVAEPRRVKEKGARQVTFSTEVCDALIDQEEFPDERARDHSVDTTHAAYPALAATGSSGNQTMPTVGENVYFAAKTTNENTTRCVENISDAESDIRLLEAAIQRTQAERARTPWVIRKIQDRLKYAKQKRLNLHIRVGSRALKAVLDTGADFSVMSEQFVRSNGLMDQTVPSGLSLKSYSGEGEVHDVPALPNRQLRIGPIYKTNWDFLVALWLKQIAFWAWIG